jgi:Antitoxin VbhA
MGSMSKHSRAVSDVDSASTDGGDTMSSEQHRLVHNAVVNNAIEGWTPTAEAIADLSEFTAGRITADEHRARVLARAGVPAPATPR